MPTWTPKFLWGAVGGVAPEVARLYKIVTATNAGDLPPFGLLYFSVSLLFVAMAGAFAIAWNDENPRKCLWVGASLPVIITTLVQQVPR